MTLNRAFAAALVLGGIVVLWLLSKRGENSAEDRATYRNGVAGQAVAHETERRAAVIDTNLRGVVNEVGGIPIAAARVCLESRTKIPGRLHCVATDRNGRFHLSSVEASQYKLHVVSSRHLPTMVTVPGSDTGNIEILLSSGGKELGGRVEDPYGAPVPEALVVIKDEARESVLAILATDVNGLFLARAPRDSVTIVAEAEGYSSAVKQVVAPTRNVTMVLTPGVVIKGQVVEQHSRKPIPGARVSAVSAAQGKIRVGESDSEGRFESFALGPGSYELEAKASAWRAPATPIDVEEGRNEIILNAYPAGRLHATVKPEMGRCEDGEVHLVGPVAIVARVASDAVDMDGIEFGRYKIRVKCPGHSVLEDEIDIGIGPVERTWRPLSGSTVSGRVVNSSGVPVPGVTVRVAPAAEPQVEAASCVSVERGQFECGPLANGEYTSSVALGDTHLGARVQFAVESAKLHIGDVLMPPSGIVRVSIQNNSGEAVDDAVVIATDRGGLQYVAERRGVGVAVLDPLPTGEYEVGLSAAVPPALKHVRLRDNEVLELQLVVSEPSVLRGIVVDENGQAVPGAWVDVLSIDSSVDFSGASPRVTSAADGTFEVRDVGPGPRKVVAWSVWGDAAVRVLDKTNRVTVVMREVGSVQGSVRAANGTPVTSFLLGHRARDGTLVMRRIAHPAGQWLLPRLPGGEVVVQVQSEIGSAEGRVVLIPGTTATLPIVLDH
jgi:hypothetical protein